MAVLLEAIHIKRKSLFEFENAPYACLDSDITTPTARGGQTLVHLKMRNLLTSAVFEKTFKANDKFKEPDLELIPASYLYSDGEGSHFLDQESYETLTLDEGMIAAAGLDVLEQEPPGDNNPLLRMDNVILTAHVASASSRFDPARRRRVGQELSLVLSGRWPMSCVNPSVLAKTDLRRWQPVSMERGPNS